MQVLYFIRLHSPGPIILSFVISAIGAFVCLLFLSASTHPPNKSEQETSKDREQGPGERNVRAARVAGVSIPALPGM